MYLKRKNTHVHTENQFTAEADTETLQDLLIIFCLLIHIYKVIK